jgi:hypothetical protein
VCGVDPGGALVGLIQGGWGVQGLANVSYFWGDGCHQHSGGEACVSCVIVVFIGC